MTAELSPDLYWESAYAIALTLLELHPDLSPEQVGIRQLANLVVNLPNFKDDPEFIEEQLLLDIQFSWYEEKTHL